jgi:hypothetical protein
VRVEAAASTLFGLTVLVRSGLVQHRQKRPLLRQQFLKRFADPHGQRSLLPRRSTSSTSPSLIVREPRLTCASEGNPLRRLLIGSKGQRCFRIFPVSWHGCLLAVAGGKHYKMGSAAKQDRDRSSRQAATILAA